MSAQTKNLANRPTKITEKAGELGLKPNEMIGKLIEKYQSTTPVAQIFGVTPNAIRWRLAEQGYSFNKETGKWEKQEK